MPTFTTPQTWLAFPGNNLSLEGDLAARRYERTMFDAVRSRRMIAAPSPTTIDRGVFAGIDGARDVATDWISCA